MKTTSISRVHARANVIGGGNGRTPAEDVIYQIARDADVMPEAARRLVMLGEPITHGVQAGRFNAAVSASEYGSLVKLRAACKNLAASPS